MRGKSVSLFVESRLFFEDLREFVKHYSLKARVIELVTPMPTAQAASDHFSVPVGSIFKSLFLVHKAGKDRAYALVVLAGDAQIDLGLVSAQLGWNSKKVSFANKEDTQEKTGFPAGGTPPIGHKENFPILVDASINHYEKGYGGGGCHEWLLEITPQELIAITDATVGQFSKITLEAAAAASVAP